MKLRDSKQISSDTFTDLAEIGLKSNIIEFDKKNLKHIRGNAIGIKFSHPYAY